MRTSPPTSRRSTRLRVLSLVGLLTMTALALPASATHEKEHPTTACAAPTRAQELQCVFADAVGAGLALPGITTQNLTVTEIGWVRDEYGRSRTAGHTTGRVNGQDAARYHPSVFLDPDSRTGSLGRVYLYKDNVTLTGYTLHELEVQAVVNIDGTYIIKANTFDYECNIVQPLFANRCQVYHETLINARSAGDRKGLPKLTRRGDALSAEFEVRRVERSFRNTPTERYGTEVSRTEKFGRYQVRVAGRDGRYTWESSWSIPGVGSFSSRGTTIRTPDRRGYTTRQTG